MTMKVVAAIDLGTSNSCCGYVLETFNPPYEPICCCPGIVSDVYEKTPTALLVRRGTLEAVSFGADAITAWQNDNNSGEPPEFHIFRRFKMALYTAEPGADTVVQAEDGYSMEVGSVIRKSLKLFKESLIAKVNRENANYITDADAQIRWYVTVPAIWPETARAKMQTWAHEAGLLRAELTLEPEAAAISNLKRSSVEDQIRRNDLRKFMLVDVGGGTVDISGIQIQKMDPLQVSNLYARRGAAYGGEQVDAKFRQMLTEVIKHAGFSRMTQQVAYELSAVMDHFAACKARYGNQRVDLNRLLDALYDERYKSTQYDREAEIRSGLSNYNRSHSTNLLFRSNFLHFNDNEMQHFFQDTVDGVCSAIRAALDEHDVSMIVVTGGLSRSRFLAAAVKEQFEPVTSRNRRMRGIIESGQPSIDIARGSVIFGIDKILGNETIQSRILSRGYGVMCIDGYRPLVKMSDSVGVGETRDSYGQPATPEQTSCLIPFYTHGADPYNRDEQRQIGNLELAIRPGIDTAVGYRIYFGDTTLRMEAMGNGSNNRTDKNPKTQPVISLRSMCHEIKYLEYIIYRT
ncbi:hypothetical protein SARC_10851 [Sphaeroforma arctica JP610]|uniref:Uncharacterized protein n=1 Tax=Sphaeroforma arctica JP610 TaxID=667725 RepID=A0A0L0FJM1_9EUKA|nr:hypothetical protein SARC_10851 [Sphaeroforma arctica JP610]KNC76656.1 hypothetical protein SARC_10851 [Sphaeroforma arctica JP610]|eukprot:XP_014150558.1 hypothetical protein SARC_10851 [Sphaeroforma arctica JP610]